MPNLHSVEGGDQISRNLEGISCNVAQQSDEKAISWPHSRDLLHLSPIPILHHRQTIRPSHLRFFRDATALLSDFADTDFATTAVFLSLIPSVRAADSGEDLINNLFSDLAPILALFGEQVAKQFLSESVGWPDNILFATAPLGVITGIISAIRVGGPVWLKALVGRAREGRADVELELMSSNSLDVGEMWNGQTIVRVLGTPSVFQLVYKLGSTEADPAKYIRTLHDRDGFFKPVVRESNSRYSSEENYDHEDDYDRPIELRPLLTGVSDQQQQHGNGAPPNISLNARGEPVGERERWAWALIGISTQLAVIVYECLISFKTSWKYLGLNGGTEPPIQALIFTVTGTVALAFGMLICSYVVESASTETDWIRKGDKEVLNVAWIQKGGVVGDQAFEPYIIFGHKGQQFIRTSQRCNEKISLRLQYWVLLGTSVGIVGFVVQFIGLRGMDWTVGLAQLVAIGLLTIIRSIIRRRMSREPTAIKAIEGHELDCMARRIGGFDGWRVIPGGSQQAQQIPPHLDTELVHRVFEIRRYLGGLTEWPADHPTIAPVLCIVMERTLNTLYNSEDIHMRKEYLEADEFCWKLGIQTLDAAAPTQAGESWFNRRARKAQAGLGNGVDGMRRGEVVFKLTRSKPFETWEPWRMSDDTRFNITTLLSLFLLRFKEEESDYRRRHPLREFGGCGKSAKALRLRPRGVEGEHFRSWMADEGMGIDLRFGKLAAVMRGENIPAYRVIGNSEREGGDRVTAVVLVPPEVPVQTLLAQELFSEFFSAVVPWIETIYGSTKIRMVAGSSPDNSNPDLGLVPPRSCGFDGLRIGNSALAHLVDVLCETGLGTKPEILMNMIPHLERHGKLPLPPVRLENLAQHSFHERRYRALRTSNNWHIIASQIQQLTNNRDGIRIGHDLESRSTRYLVTRFCKRILALATPGENDQPGTSDQPQLKFLKWLEELSIEDLQSITGEQEPPNTMNLSDGVMQYLWRENIVNYLREEGVAKLRMLLSPFSPLCLSIVESEIQLLRNTMDITSHEGLVQALKKAASDGNDSIVEALRDRGLDTTARDIAGESALTLAASNGHESVVQLLVLHLLVHSRKTYQDLKVGHRTAALWSAAKNGHIPVVKLLVMLTWDSGGTCAEQRNTALILAAANGHGRLVRELIADGADAHAATSMSQNAALWNLDRTIADMRTQDSDTPRPAEPPGDGNMYRDFIVSILNYPNHKVVAGAVIARTALQAAASGGQLDVVNYLFGIGVDVNAAAAGSSGRTALQAAAGGGHLVVTDALLKCGAHVNGAPGLVDGRSALQAAAEGGHLAVVNRLLEMGADVNAVAGHHSGRTALQAAAGGGHFTVVNRLLEMGANVNGAPGEFYGQSALQAAAEGGHLAVVNRLLEMGADVNAAAGHNSGRTALQAASEGGHLAVVNRLLEMGANANGAPGRSGGRSALQAAAEGGHLAVVNRLLEMSADVNATARDDSGRTALQAAAGGGHFTVVNRLLEMGANANGAPVQSGGRSALQAAAEGGHLAVVNRLLEMGADVNAAPGQWGGRSALQAAAEGGHLAVVNRLLEMGVDVNAAPALWGGRSALQAAAEEGHLAVVNRLLQMGTEAGGLKYGGEALRAAVAGGYIEVADRLREAGIVG